ncbi:MAG: SufE family protein [Bacteroidetes bacterium]|nr:SufE family protein [Bacteroidota bacterium]MCH8245614.1 SufE family protein [Bacteroidota bacterium]
MTPIGTIAERAGTIVDEFALFDDWMGKYEHLIEMGRSLPLIDEAYKTNEYLVRGCQAQVWLKAEAEGDLIRLTADSDALITKGLIAILLCILDRQPADAVVGADFSFLDEIGMKEHLSPTRKNGLDSMIKQIRLYAALLSHSKEVS